MRPGERRRTTLRRAAIAAALVVAVVGVMWIEEMRPPPADAPRRSAVPRPAIGDAAPAHAPGSITPGVDVAR